MSLTDAYNAEPRVYSVSRLNREVKNLLEGGFGRIQVAGEISNLATPPSGHLYFTLKDPQAQVSCALFRGRASKLGFQPENGMQVQASAQVTLYENRGNYQLIVQNLEEAGDGALRRAFEQLKAKLSAEGLFAEQLKKPIPALPHCIGVVTSPGGAAIRDILTVLRRRFPGIPVIIYPTVVQGITAPKQIISAIQTAKERAECDVLLLTRGGGSLEDLWSFNDEQVARCVFDCPIPVISAVGHEIDFVITDFVADKRAATPSAAAELVSPDQAELRVRISTLYNRIHLHFRQRLQRLAERLDWLERRFQQTRPDRMLQQKSQRLDELQQRLIRSQVHFSAGKQSRLQELYARLQHQSPVHRLQQTVNRNIELTRRLRYSVNLQITRRRERLAMLSRALDAISPLATLKRGYSITRHQADGQLVQDAATINTGDQIETRLAKGCIISEVKETRSS